MSKRKKSSAPNPADPPLVLTKSNHHGWDREADVIVVGYGGAGVCAALEARSSGADTLAAARETVPDDATDLVHGITLIEDVVIARTLATTTEPVKRLFDALWRVWRPRVCGHEPGPPRIWAT